MATPEQAEKRHEHIAVAKAPDWKYTPQKPNKGVPVPYWTVAYFDEAIHTANQSNGRKNDYFISVSRVPVSRGGEAGKGKGVLSNTYMDEFEPTEWSNTLHIDQGFAVFHGHAGIINKGNAPAKVYTGVNPADAIADKACWEQLKTNLSALGVAGKDRLFADPVGCGKNAISGAWNQIAGDVQAAGGLLEGLWGGIKSFFSDPIGTAGTAIDGLEQFGQQAYESGKQVVGVIEGLRNGSITMEDLMDFAADMMQGTLCSMAEQVEEMVKNGKGCEAMGVILGVAAEQVALVAATMGAGTAAKGAQLLVKAGVSKGDDLAAAIKKLKNYKKKFKNGNDKDIPKKPPKAPGKNDSSTPGTRPSPTCVLCPQVGNPVNPVLGVKVQAGEEDLDFDLPAPLPLPWQRSYVSSNAHIGWLGQGWSTPLSLFIEEKRSPRGKTLTLVDEFGREILFPPLRPGEQHFHDYEQVTLKCLQAGWFELSTPDQSRHLLFGRLAEGDKRHPLRAIIDRNDNIIRIHYDPVGALPERITDSAGRILALHFETLPQQADATPAAKRLTRIDLIAGPGAWDTPPPIGLPPQPLVTYAYNEAGDLISVRDRLGRIHRRFEYRRHILTAHTHSGGVRVEYTYDQESPQGRVLSSHSSTGEHYDFDYRRARTLVTDQLGRRQIFRFDRHREWTGHTDALGGRTVREIDAFGNLIGLTDPAGRKTTYAYDASGRPTRIRLPASSGASSPEITLNYDETSGQLDRLTDENGATTRYRYDEVGNLAEVTDALGQTTRYAYDARGLPVAITDALGKTKTLQYNDAGQITAYTDCSGQTTRYAYDAWGHLSEITDALGQTTGYKHDPLGRLLSLTHPDGRQEHFTYDEAGRLVAYTDPSGARTGYTLDADGRPLQRTNASGGALTYEYDSARRLSGLLNENGARYDFTYDALDRLIAETGFDARHTRYRYDATGLLTARLEAGALSAQERLEQSAQPPQHTRPEASPGILPPQRGIPTLEDPWGLLPADIDAPLVPPPGHTLLTRYERDHAGHLLAKQVAGHILLADGRAVPQHKSTRYAYDVAGRLIEATNDEGARITLAYDPLGRLIREERHGEGDAAILHHAYDALGNRIATTLPDGRNLRWLYYGSGHLHQISLDGHPVCDIERDALHREITRSQGALTRRTTYDALGRPVEQAAYRTYRTHRTHSGADPLSGAMSASPLSAARRGAHPQTSPDPWAGASSPGELPDPHAGDEVLGRRYAYDAAGNLTGIDDLIAGPTRYAYDALGRLIRARTGALEERFAFDPAHNLMPVKALPGSAPQPPDNTGLQGSASESLVNTGLALDPSGTLSHTGANDQPQTHVNTGLPDSALETPDNSGLAGSLSANAQSMPATGQGILRNNRLEVFGDIRYRYDTHGNLVEKRIAKHTHIRLVWDVEHQLQEAIVTRTLRGRTQTTRTRYRYDAFGRRLDKCTVHVQDRQKSGRQSLNQRTPSRTRYDWDGNRLLAEYRQGRSILYLYEADSFAPLAQVVDTTKAGVNTGIADTPSEAPDNSGLAGNLSETRINKGLAGSLSANARSTRATGQGQKETGATNEAERDAGFMSFSERDAQANDRDDEENAEDDADLNWNPRQAREAFMQGLLREKRAISLQMKTAALPQPPRPNFAFTPEDDDAPKTWKVLYYHTDQIGTPRELTDEDGNIVWQATYKAWGNILQESWPAADGAAGRSAAGAAGGHTGSFRQAKISYPPILRTVAEGNTLRAQWIEQAEDERPIQNLRFQGQYFDEETGLHYNRFRYYDPDVGRFVSQDPIRLAGGLNLYEYTLNPTGWIDIYGLQKCKPCPIDCEKILSDEGVTTGRHGELKKIGGLQDSHHIYQDAAVNGIKGYDYNEAIAISIQGRNLNGTTRGTPHYNANQIQNTAKTGGILGSETVIAFKALRAAGLSPQAAKCATLKAREYLHHIGGNAGTTTQIPSKRKIP